MLLAKKQVGYTVARVATDLRLEMLRALLVSRWQYFLKQPLGSLANSMATESSQGLQSVYAWRHYDSRLYPGPDLRHYCFSGLLESRRSCR